MKVSLNNMCPTFGHEVSIYIHVSYEGLKMAIFDTFDSLLNKTPVCLFTSACKI